MLESIGEVSWSAAAWLLAHLVVLNMFLSVVIIFFQRRKPATVWTWLLVLYFIPVLGFGLYLILGQDHRKSRMFRKKEIEEELKFAVRRQEESLSRNQMHFHDEQMQRFQGLMLYNLNAAESVLTDNNDVRIYTDGLQKFEALAEEMERARKYIHIQYYIIRNDAVWQRLLAVMIRKAQQGVKVRVLYDSMGCRMMKKADWQRIREAGIEVGEFFPALFGKLHLRINYRNHRKIVVIDGRVGFLGGFNVGQEYVGEVPKFGYWRDTHICIEGAAVTSLAVRFVMDWNYATKQNLFQEDTLFEIPRYQREGKIPLQIISSGPDSLKQEVRNNYLKLINEARDHIYIQSPYFIPDETIITALIIAVQTGVEVKIMIPCKPDHPFVYWASYSYLGELLEAGAKCYVYENGFLHAKMVTIDGLVSCCGTANMDIRSFQLNFEVNATIYSAETTRELEQAFQQDLEAAAEINLAVYRKRSVKIRIKEQVCRLLSPIL
ncbi:MAG: cardiolipin synthase [Lachnospiraceae bacterium]